MTTLLRYTVALMLTLGMPCTLSAATTDSISTDIQAVDVPAVAAPQPSDDPSVASEDAGLQSAPSTEFADTTGMLRVRKEKVEVVHARKGDVSEGADKNIRLLNIATRQQYSQADTESYDTDIMSPKSARFSTDGSTLFVNSLEGARTVVYDAATMEKKGVIHYNFISGNGDLWAPPSGYYPFTHYPDGENIGFFGKPVESALSHGGRYLWVPFYRRTFDRNAQDPSAIAVVDTHTLEIVRMFETGPLPKMVAVSPDDRYVAITHWGDNTVGFIDISSEDMDKWHHLPPVTVGRKFVPNYPLDRDVDRDKGSGFLIRGTAFSPDGKWLLVSAMSGALYVIDVTDMTVASTVPSLYGIRHLAIHGNDVYGSKNMIATVVKFSLDTLIANVEKARAEGRMFITPGKVREVMVGKGTRTLDVSPDGRYVFVACNNESTVKVLNASDLSLAAEIRADSYPVGLALSPDGRTLAVTSQGKKDGGGGNAVNVYRVQYAYLPELPAETTAPAEDGDSAASPAIQLGNLRFKDVAWCTVGLLVLAANVIMACGGRRRRNDYRRR